MLGRVWSKARGPWAQRWTATSTPSWDAAVKGAMSLQEDFRRLLDDETSAVLAIPYAHSLLDLEQHYDITFWLKPVRAAIRLEFPPTELFLDSSACIPQGAQSDPG
eukprot:9500569-Pyramimonas_sp.AAC.1